MTDLINCRKCGAETGPVFGLCAACVQADDAEGAAPVSERPAELPPLDIPDPCPTCHRPTRYTVNTSVFEICFTCGQAFPAAVPVPVSTPTPYG